MKTKVFTEKEIEAAKEFIARQDRGSHPEGSTDRAGRWYPAGEDEKAFDFCGREPSRAWPWSYMTRCRTAAHVARLYDVDVTKLRSAARILRRDQKMAEVRAQLQDALGALPDIQVEEQLREEVEIL